MSLHERYQGHRHQSLRRCRFVVLEHDVDVVRSGHRLQVDREWRRTSATTFVEEDLGAVAFVPMIGEHGWREEDDFRSRR